MRRKLTLTALANALTLLLACAAAGLAQQPQPHASSASVVGRVTDPRGAAVAGAAVTLYARDRTSATRLATVTDEAGAYRFECLAPGEYVLETEARGFARAASRVLRVNRDSSRLTIDVALEVAGVSEEVVVTASDSPQTADEVSKAVNVVGRGEIEERDEFSIPDALRTVPGLRVQQLGGPGSFVSIKTRGLRNQDTAVLIDGLRLRDVTAPQGDATGFLGDLFVTNAGRIEVLRGSGSSVYGTNAIGGVVNVVTDEGGGPFRGHLLAEGGGLGFFRGRAQIAGGAGEADRLVYSAALSHLNVSRGVDSEDDARNTSGQGRAVVRLNPTTTLTARLYASDTFLRLNEEPEAVGTLSPSGIIDARPLARGELSRYEAGTPAFALDAVAATFIPGANDPDNSRAARFFSGAVTFARQASERFGYSVTYHGLATRKRFADGPAGVTFFEPAGSVSNNYDGRTDTLNARADLLFGRNSINAGYEFERERYENNFFSSFDPSGEFSIGVTERSHTFFIQDRLRLLDDRLQLSAAFRMQSFSLGRSRFEPASNTPYQGATFESPRAAYTGDGTIAYLFRSTATKLRAHVGNGYRAPSLYERFGTFFFGGFSALGDPRLRPERSIAFDLGLDQTFARSRLSATYFYTRLQEVVGFGDIAGDPFGRFSGFLNTGGGLARGVELSGDFAPTDSLDLFAAYTYTNSDQRQAFLGETARAFGVPDQQFSLVATQRVGRRLFFNFDLTASSNYLAPVFDGRTFHTRVYRFSGVVRGDLGASYTFPLSESRALRIFGKVENVFDREYYENGFRTPGVNGRAGAAYSF